MTILMPSSRVSLAIALLCCVLANEIHAFDKSRTLIASTLEYPPYEFTEAGVAKGIAVDIIREAARRTGVERVEFNFLPWKRAVLVTRNGQADLLFNAGKNDERQVWGEYVESVLILQQYVLFKRRADQIQVASDFSDVKDRTIAIRRGYLYGTGPFRQALDQQQFSEVIDSSSTEQSINLLLKNRVDLLVGDWLPVMYFITQNNLSDKIDIVLSAARPGQNLVVLTWPTYMLFSKKTVSSDYVQEVNAAMEQMRSEGYIERVFDNYTRGLNPELQHIDP